MIAVWLQPWLGALAVIGVLTVLAITVRRHRRRRDVADRVVVANAARSHESPLFRRVHARYAAVLAFQALALGAVAVSATALVARPGTERVDRSNPRQRDIMLCLDVSGSMTDIDAAIVDVFIDFVGRLDGDRVGLTIWNASGVTVFPLTDDYEFARQSLIDTQEGFVDFMSNALDGTYEGDGSSLIGDGVGTCALRFDRVDDHERRRSMILATDNELSGDPVLELDEAVAMVRDSDITMYALAPDWGFQSDELVELQRASESTGGLYFGLEDESAVESILDRINEREGTETEQPPELIRNDRPNTWVTIGLAAALLAAVAALVVRR